MQRIDTPVTVHLIIALISCVETFMGSSTTCSIYSRLAANVQRQTICSWATLWTEDTTASRLSFSSLP